MHYLMKFFKENKGLILGTFGLIFVQSIGTLLIPFLVANIIDQGILAGDSTRILQIGGQMLIVSAVTVVCAIVASYTSADLAAKLGRDLRNDFFAKSQEVSVQQLDEIGTSSLLARTTSDVTNIQQVMMMFLQMILPAPFLCIASIILTGMISFELMLIPFISIAVFVFISAIVIRKAQPEAERTQKRMDQMIKVLREFFTGARVIRAFRKNDYEENRTNHVTEKYAQVMIRVNRLFAVLNPAVSLVIGLSLTAVLYFGGILSGLGTIQVGSITAVVEYIIISLGYITMASMVVVMLPRAFVSLERINELLDLETEVKDTPKTTLDWNDSEAVLNFEGVSFSYEEAEESVLEDINFELRKGQTTAIIGGTGSGKSTIAKAMLRFKDITAGTIRLNGVSTQEISQKELRENISYVPQKAFLFSGTIRENLIFGHPTATESEINQAVEVAQAKEFIENLPLAYEAPVAQKGMNFSGGQKQRLSIARALAKKAPIYFFDDSFSALDYHTDAVLRKRLKEEYQDAAMIIVAQRINTVMDADQIIVLHEGKMVGCGKHDELMKTCQVYQDFAHSQGIGGEQDARTNQFRSA